MPVAGYRKAWFAIAAFCILLASTFAGFLAQSPQPSPSPEPSPTASASPTAPPRTPSPTPLPGAQNFHQWGSITVFSGLPSDSVRAVAQTPDGVMWFGTDNGLARFDGRRIETFSLGGAEADRILVVRTVASGDLWIGTRAGAFVFSEGRFFPIAGTENIGITAILLGSEIYLGTDSGLILRVAAEAESLAARSTIPAPLKADDGGALGITGLLENDGRLLASSAGRGVFVLKDGSLSEFLTSPRPLFVNALAQSETGELWLGAEAARGASGVYLVDGGTRLRRITATTADVQALEANNAGLWVGTERYGLFHISEGKLKKAYTFANTSGGLRSDTIYTLFTDREGVIWIGTNRGVSRFDHLGPMQQTVSDIPNSNFIRTLYQAPGEEGLLYAGSNRGLFTLDRRSDTWKEVPAFRNKVIYAIRKRYATSIVVGAADGLFDLTGRKLLDGDVRSFAGFNVRDYAAVFGKGVYDITDDAPKLVFADPAVTALGERWNQLWIGTLDRGLLNYAGTTVNTAADPEKLKSGTIWGVSNTLRNGSANGPAYIAGQHGVFVIRDDGTVEQIISAEDVRDVVERDGQIWAASTTRGLLHARADERFGWLVTAIGFEQGLPSEKAFGIQPAGASFIVATNRGIVTYRPGTIAPKLIAVRVLSQRVHDLSEARSTIALDYPQKSLLVEVAGLSSRTFPEEFQYGFVLKNAGRDILDKRLSNDPEYAPADLEPGDYSIEATAFDRDLLASEPLTVRFSVAQAPFPWTATALGVLLAIAVVALIWAIVERRRIITQSRELAAARLDLAHEAERERSRIARDLHDQTLADLRVLMMKSDSTLPPGTGFREDIESISTEIRRICEDLSPSVLENVGFTASLEFLLSSTFEKYRFDPGPTTEDQIALPVNVQLQVYRIAQEVLSNIKRHASADIVDMTVAIPDRGAFELSIINDGPPFSPSESNRHGGRGIAGIRSRASLIRAEIRWDETPDGRSRFHLYIPAQG